MRRILLAVAVMFGISAITWPASAGTPHQISWDNRSLKIDGQRAFIWSGEMHPFRLPSPSLWRDVLQKMKAMGFNAVTYYIPWGYFTPKRGVYDFSGIRDVDRALSMAEQEGLYVIVRAGPYVNAELTRGGFPTWLVTQRAKARTDAPEYLDAVDEWYAHINPILKRHQLTDGGGSIILYQIENELPETTPAHARYMQHLYDRARADGITVPIFHNDIGRNGYWVPKSSTVANTVAGPTDLYAWDSYPGGSCNVDATAGTPNAAPDFGWYGTGGAKGGSSASPGTPGFTAEFGNGWFDYWGSNGTYDCTSRRIGGGYERVFYGANIANGLTLESFYMIFGGTSWGWQPAPVVYTSYDYGATIDETRGLRPKALVLKQLGQFVQAAAPTLAGMTKGPAVQPQGEGVKLYHNLNPDNGAHLIVAVHSPSNSVGSNSFAFTLDTSDGHYTVPQAGTLRLRGQDSKLLLAAYDLERQRLVYSTSQLQTQLRQGDHDVALFYGRDGEDGETVLRYSSPPTVQVLEGNVASTFDAATGNLRLDYVHRKLHRVLISGGGRPSLLLLLGDEKEAQRFWRLETAAETVLVRGPLVRHGEIRGDALALTGDTSESGPLEVWTTPAVGRITWNGAPIAVTPGTGGSLLAQTPLAGPEKITLPDIWKGPWLRRMGSPEAARNFDDTGWAKATAGPQGLPATPAGLPMLTMDSYGFHHGDVWYRGRYKGDGASSRLELVYGGGGVGLLQVWIDGHFLGQHELPSGQPRPQTTGTALFTLPKAAFNKGEHIVAVMVRNDGHNWDLEANDFHKEGRGLIMASLSTPNGSRFAVPIAWKLQGMSEELFDPVRGVMNVGGSYGELHGWHLPHVPATGWQAANPGSAPTAAGTLWLRTEFDLALPQEHDIQLGLAIGKAGSVRSDRQYRALIFVNGWQMGQFIAHVGPQRVFVLPPGIINPRGRNTLALAVTSDGKSGNALEPVRLVALRTARGGPAVEMVSSPDHPSLFKGTR